jgi:hypothetical protein
MGGHVEGLLESSLDELPWRGTPGEGPMEGVPWWFSHEGDLGSYPPEAVN